MTETIVVTVRIVRPTAEHPLGYLGAQSAHPMQPGETWQRSMDLADGPCSEETLSRLTDDLRAIMEGFPKASFRDASG